MVRSLLHAEIPAYLSLKDLKRARLSIDHRSAIYIYLLKRHQICSRSVMHVYGG